MKMDLIDNFLRFLGIQNILIVYFNYADLPAVHVLKKHYGLRAKVIKLEPEANILPPEASKYPLVIIIGPNTNPIIERLIKMKVLRKTSGIFALGNTIVIVGKDPLETFELTANYIRNNGN